MPGNNFIQLKIITRHGQFEKHYQVISLLAFAKGHGRINTPSFPITQHSTSDTIISAPLITSCRLLAQKVNLSNAWIIPEKGETIHYSKHVGSKPHTAIKTKVEKLLTIPGESADCWGTVRPVQSFRTCFNIPEYITYPPLSSLPAS